MTDWVRCPNCRGEVGVPDVATGNICCPQCKELVYSVDPKTQAKWKAPNPKPTWMKPWGYGLLVLGVLGFLASALVERTLLGALISGLLNPLFFVGCPLGYYWLSRSKKQEIGGKSPTVKYEFQGSIEQPLGRHDQILGQKVESVPIPKSAPREEPSGTSIVGSSRTGHASVDDSLDHPVEKAKWDPAPNQEPKPTLGSVGERLELLEAKNRSLTLECRITEAAIALLALIALVASTSHGGVPMELKVQKLFVCEPDGKCRVSISSDADGNSSLAFFDRDGKPRLDIGSNSFGSAHQRFLDKDGTPRVTTGYGFDGKVGQWLYDKSGKPRLEIATSPDGSVWQRILDRDGKPRYSIASTPDNSVGQLLFGSDKSPRFETMVLADDTARQTLYDRRGKKRMAAWSGSKDSAGLGFYDAEQKQRIGITTLADGMAGQQFWDKEGKLRITMGTILDRLATQQFYDSDGKLRLFLSTLGDRVLQAFQDQRGNAIYQLPR